MYAACRFFDPSQARIDAHGSVLRDDYPFDRAFRNFDACWCPGRGANSSHWEMCDMGENQPNCRYYSPEEPHRLRFVRLGAGPYRFAILDRSRVADGVAEYRIISWRTHNPEASTVPEGAALDHALNTTTDRDAGTTATALFETLIGDDEATPVGEPETEASYLAGVRGACA